MRKGDYVTRLFAKSTDCDCGRYNKYRKRRTATTHDEDLVGSGVGINSINADDRLPTCHLLRDQPKTFERSRPQREKSRLGPRATGTGVIDRGGPRVLNDLTVDLLLEASDKRPHRVGPLVNDRREVGEGGSGGGRLERLNLVLPDEGYCLAEGDEAANLVWEGKRQRV